MNTISIIRGNKDLGNFDFTQSKNVCIFFLQNNARGKSTFQSL